MKTTKRIIAMLLAVILLISAAACGKKGEEEEKETAAETQAESKVETENQPAEKPEEEKTTATFTDYLIAEKIGTLNTDHFATNNGGLTYKADNGLQGIMSYEGLYDTGAIYSYIGTDENYFIVRKTLPASADDIAGLNSAQLVDSKGKAVVPGSFAAFNILNERYIYVVTATKRVATSDNAIMTYRTDTGSTYTFITEGDVCSWYEGTWTVYDITTGAPVPGATGSHNNNISAKGDCLEYKDIAGNYVKINSKGEAIPENASLFNNGTYKIEGKIGDVYSADGTRIFSYDLTGYIPSYSEGDYYLGRMYGADGKTRYAVMDKNGVILSEGYTALPSIYGQIVKCDDIIYNLNGQKLVEGSFSNVYMDNVLGNNWILYNKSSYTMIDVYGNVYFNIANTDNVTVSSSDFTASKKLSDGTYFYSHKDKDFTIKGGYFAPWIVCANNNNSMEDLIDTMTGKKLLEGYYSYSKIPRGANAYYVYAKYNGGTDIYFITSASNLDKITQIKTNLYDDLSAAFAAEGLSVTVDKVNGEIALDTAILFGGDSAVLSAEGKEFLNKFIKAYTSVAYSEKYKGFITKTLVEGHTAPLAGSTYASGYALSLERATNVMNYCLSAEAGTTAASPIANTLEAVGYSNSQPIYNADGTVNLDASRRVSFRFMVNIEF